jgi:hypothetical protein
MRGARVLIAAVSLLGALTAACGGASNGGPLATATATATPAFHLERAPIESIELTTAESLPPQYGVRIKSGLPSGCHTFESATLTRSGTHFDIDVENRVTGGPNQACTAIYGIHEAAVMLGSDLIAGTTYDVAVNDKTLTFTASATK